MARTAFHDEFVDYYTILGAESTSSYVEIRQQYLKLVLRYHPDRNPGREAEVLPQFQLIQKAHEVLKDPKLRELFDQRRLLEAGRPDGVLRFRPKKSGPKNDISTKVASKVSVTMATKFAEKKKKQDRENVDSKDNNITNFSLHRSFSASGKMEKNNSFKEVSTSKSYISSGYLHPKTSPIFKKNGYASENVVDPISSSPRFKGPNYNKFNAKLYLESLREKRRTYTPLSEISNGLNSNGVENSSITKSSPRSSSSSNNERFKDTSEESIIFTSPNTPEHPSVYQTDITPEIKLEHSDNNSPSKPEIPFRHPTSKPLPPKPLSRSKSSSLSRNQTRSQLNDLSAENDSTSNSTEYDDQLQSILRSLAIEGDDDEVAKVLPKPPSVPTIQAPIPPEAPRNLTNASVDSYLNSFEMYQRRWSSYSIIYTQYAFQWQIFKNKCFQLDLMNTPGQSRLIDNWKEGSQAIQLFYAYEQMHLRALEELQSLKESLFASFGI